MNWKLVLVGGLVFWIVTFIVGFATGPIIHQGILDAPYKANAQFWQPALAQDPPDMAALMPRWIATGILTGWIIAWLYGCVRSALGGPAWKRGLLFGLGLAILNCAFILGYSGVFNLPSVIWTWWAIEGFFYYLIGGAVLGWIGQKLAPVT
jgi:hypothetical protein